VTTQVADSARSLTQAQLKADDTAATKQRIIDEVSAELGGYDEDDITWSLAARLSEAGIFPDEASVRAAAREIHRRA
jgi:hypothetical protein